MPWVKSVKLWVNVPTALVPKLALEDRAGDGPDNFNSANPMYVLSPRFVGNTTL